jgi:hypothetical protein
MEARGSAPKPKPKVLTVANSVPIRKGVLVVTLQAEAPKAPKEASRKSFRGASTSESSTLMDCLDEVEFEVKVEAPPPSAFSVATDDEEPAPGGQPTPTAWVLVPVPTISLGKVDQIPSEAEHLHLVQNFGD